MIATQKIQSTERNIEVRENLEIRKSELAIFDDRTSYVSCSRVYYAYFEKIPSLIRFGRINYRRVINWIENEMADRILKKHSRREYEDRNKFSSETMVYVLKNNLLICLGQDGSGLILYEQNGNEAAELIFQRVIGFRRRKRKTTDFSVITRGMEGFRLVDINNRKPDLQLQRNYNDDLIPLHQNILKKLRSEKTSGLILFHGAPGTGKTTYIRYLIHCLNKRVIFLSPKLAGNLDSPDLIKLLLENPDSVLLIEDAEDLIASRDSDKNSGISMLLNLSDGILGESLGIQVICTFNTSIANIDRALLRKGRLIGAYEFKPLCVAKSKVLLHNLGVTTCIPHQPMTLAEIYHVEANHFEFKAGRNAIGFVAAAA